MLPHVQDTVVIVEEGNITHPLLPHCDMLVLWADLNICHINKALCSNVEDRNIHSLDAEEAWGET